jgi:hypothetical protein
VRSIIVNIFFQAVIFLYLLDNNQETSWMIMIGQGMGLLIEVWKVFKALKYEVVWRPGRLLPSLATKTTTTTEEEDETSKYDAIAFKYLTWLSYPLLAGYAVYSLLYDEHKSWYSFVLKTLVEFVYLFGFITMIPQLYINYRLKSVSVPPQPEFRGKWCVCVTHFLLPIGGSYALEDIDVQVAQHIHW